ncbi:MAG TPA: hypothetical protein ENH82_10340 [bacterium]|nr:hypothetical protein [bacterium]
MQPKIHLRGTEISWSLYNPACGEFGFGHDLTDYYKDVTCKRCKKTKKYKMKKSLYMKSKK